MPVPGDTRHSLMVDSIVKTAEGLGLECERDARRGFINDTVDVVLTREGRRAFAVVTYKAGMNATTDDGELKGAFKEAAGHLESTPQQVLLVTTIGFKWERLGDDFGGFEDPAEWERYEDVAAITEGDRIAERFLKR